MVYLGNTLPPPNTMFPIITLCQVCSPWSKSEKAATVAFALGTTETSLYVCMGGEPSWDCQRLIYCTINVLSEVSHIVFHEANSQV